MNLSLPFERLSLGDRFATRGRTVTEADVVGFAAQTGDFHPQHCDAAWAAASPFGERIAHGMLVVSYAVGLVPFDPERVVALRRADATFKRPVKLGDTIRVEGGVLALEPRRGGGPGDARLARAQPARAHGLPRARRRAVEARSGRARRGRGARERLRPDPAVMLLAEKKLLVTGVVTRDSIAWHVARRAQEEDAEVVLTGFGRARRLTERAARQLPVAADVLELDVDSESDLLAVREELDRRWGGVDGVLHAVAYAPEDALGGDFLATPPASAERAFRTSAYSLKGLTEAVLPLMDPGASVVGLDFDAQVAWPAYDWMGVAKAGLEAVARYLARDLGPRGIRVNLVSAGPIRTLAAGGIPGFERLRDAWSVQAPLGWDVDDAEPVADAVCFLLSDLARAITGEIVHVDGGFHAVAAVPVEAALPR
jgi:enoyl ACP reductase